MKGMKDTTMLKWLYMLELTAPVFYRVNNVFISDKEEKEKFTHFEQNELPHSPMIKEFLKEHYNMSVYPIPKAIIQLGTMLVSLLIGFMGKKVIYYFEYRFEKKAVEAYTNLMNDTNDPKIKKLAKQLCDEELPHREFFKKKLGYKD